MTSYPLSTWQAVAHDAELLRRAATCDPQDVASVSRLRKHADADRVGVALELLQARRKAAVKFPGQADTLLADVSGIEQATSLTAATHKAKRLLDSGIANIVDACCGIGGDTMAFAAADLNTTTIDRDPVRAWMAQVNAGCASRVADVEELLHQPPPADTALHLDPARRTGAGRVFRLADYQPSPPVITALIEHFRDTAIKLSPAVNLDELQSQLPPGEIEFVSEAGRLVQAILWTGRLQSPSLRTATLLLDHQTHTLSGSPETLDLSPPRRFLYTIDAAVERAGLLHLLNLPAIHPRLGLLTSDDLADNPWLTGFELLAELPFSPKNPRKVKAWLDNHDAGLVEIKTRGKAVDPDPLQQSLRGTGTTPYTLFVLRFDQRLVCFITQRLSV